MAYQHCQKLYLIMGGNIMNKKICSIVFLSTAIMNGELSLLLN